MFETKVAKLTVSQTPARDAPVEGVEIVVLMPLTLSLATCPDGLATRTRNAVHPSSTRRLGAAPATVSAYPSDWSVTLASVYLDNIFSAASTALASCRSANVSSNLASAAETGCPIAANAAIARFIDAKTGCELLEVASAAIGWDPANGTAAAPKNTPRRFRSQVITPPV